MANPLMCEGVWFDKYKVDDAEKVYYENRAKDIGGLVVQNSSNQSNSDLAGQIARARQNIQNTLNSGVGLGIGVTVDSPELAARLSAVEKENAELRKVTADLQEAVKKLTARVNALDKASSSAPTSAASKAQQEPEEEDDDDDDDIDLFGSENEDDEEVYAKMEAQRKAEASKKPKKVVIAKSSILLDVKPWDDETDMTEVEKAVRTIETDGLLWGASKLVPLAYGIKKLQICCVVEDDKVGTDFLEEEITKFEELVQSVDIAAFNKI